MKKWLCLIFILSIQKGFSFSYKLNDEKEIRDLVYITEGYSSIHNLMASLSLSKGLSAKIVQLECKQKVGPCPKGYDYRSCVISRHRISYEAKAQNGKIKKGNITFETIDNNGEYQNYTCKSFYNRMKKVRLGSGLENLKFQ